MPDDNLNVDRLERRLTKEFDRKEGNSCLDCLMKRVLKRVGTPFMFHGNCSKGGDD